MPTTIIFETSALRNLSSFTMDATYVSREAVGFQTLKLSKATSVKKDKLPYTYNFLIHQNKNPHITFKPHITALSLIEILGQQGYSAVIPENVMIESLNLNGHLERTNHFQERKIAYYHEILAPFFDDSGKFNEARFQRQLLKDIDAEKPFLPKDLGRLESLILQQYNLENHLLPLLKDPNIPIKPFVAKNKPGLSRLINDTLMCLYKVYPSKQDRKHMTCIYGMYLK